jgi:hypothetical protein
MTDTVEGGFAYGYLFMSQHRNTPQVFKQLLAEIEPARILEIGTFHGGLTLMLRDIMDELNLHNNIIRTYDINDQEFLKPLVVNKAVDVRTENLFDYENTSFITKEAEDEIRSFIRQDGLTLVLCDGGCKRCEYNILAPLLKMGDIIMAHDYSPNLGFFKEHMQDQIWNWLEIEDSHIIDISQKENLKPYMQDLLQTVAWLIKYKYE